MRGLSLVMRIFWSKSTLKLYGGGYTTCTSTNATNCLELADMESSRKLGGGGTTASIESFGELASFLERQKKRERPGSLHRTAIMLGLLTKNCEIKASIPRKDKSMFSAKKYKFFLEAPFEISNKCCDLLKKAPVKRYQKETGRKPITAQMACESRLRTQKWLQSGCNAFDLKEPKSNPMSFWTEQDVLKYIHDRKLSICSIYGKVIKVNNPQMTFADLGLMEPEEPIYKTTGCTRSGCVLCGFGCHLEKPGEGRFVRLKATHPKIYGLLDVMKNSGYTMREAIEWTNEHGHLRIEL